MSTPLPRVTVTRLLERYEVLLLDAYGVLIDHDGALPGARELVAYLGAASKPYFILTNDASRSPQRSAERYAGMGLEVPPERIITSGTLLAPHFRDHDLRGAACLVLGPDDSRAFVVEAGGSVVPPSVEAKASVLVICDEMGFPYREHLDLILGFLYRRLDAGHVPHLVLANPDLVYPAAPGRWGFTAGAMALALEAALDLRYPGRGLRFLRLGKPYPPMFEEALRRSGTRSMVMIGDQLDTDIRGAASFGIDSALVTTGISRPEAATRDGAFPPTYLLESLELGTR